MKHQPKCRWYNPFHSWSSSAAECECNKGKTGMKKIVFLVGESGAGKTHLVDRLIERDPKIYKRITTTVTRPPREGEVDGKDYHFVNRLQFANLRCGHHLLQEVEFGGHNYGTELSEYMMVDQPIGLFVCTPVGVTDTINALEHKGIGMEDGYEIIFFLSSNQLLEDHGISQERIGRGNIRRDFLERYITNNFEGITVYTVCDKDVNDELAERIDSAIY